MNVIGRLALRHAKDVFIAECNTGSAWNGCRRLDAWVMPKSWSPFTTIGYEVKESRSDFLRDDKWHAYLDVCHQLYFACPAKLIAPEELPAEVGLLWTLGDERLVVKRKAVKRDPDPAKLVNLMAYALMSRSRIVTDMHQANANGTKLDTWRRWLTEREASRMIGHIASRKLNDALREARGAQAAAEERTRNYQQLEKRLTELGLDIGRPVNTWNLERALGNPRSATDALHRIERHAKDVLRECEAALSYEERRKAEKVIS